MSRYTAEEIQCVIEATECRIEEAKANGDATDRDIEEYEDELERLRGIKDHIAATEAFP